MLKDGWSAARGGDPRGHASRIVLRGLARGACGAEQGLAVRAEDRDAAGNGHHVRRERKARRVLGACGHVRGREAPGSDRLRLGQRKIHHARAVAVHPQRRNEVTPRVDDCDRMALHLRPGVRGAAGDDRLGEPHRARRDLRCAGAASEAGGGDESA